jgi:hypothetical protein
MKNDSHANVVKSIVLSLSMAALCYSGAYAQAAASYGQQIAIAKTLKPGLATIGVFGSNLSDKMIDMISRAANGQGVKIVVAKPQDAGQVSQFYAKLVVEKGAEFIWLPDASDAMMLGIGFEFLRGKALADKVGLIVPQESLVATGGTCTMLVEGGKLRVIVNQKIAEMIGLSVPRGDGESITYVTR